MDSLKHTWKEVVEQILDDIWQKVIQRIYSSSVCLGDSIIQFKVVQQLNWSMVKLSKFKFKILNLHAINVNSSQLHYFTCCEHVQSYHIFLSLIFEVFSKISGQILLHLYIAIFRAPPQNVNLIRPEHCQLSYYIFKHYCSWIKVQIKLCSFCPHSTDWWTCQWWKVAQRLYTSHQSSEY